MIKDKFFKRMEVLGLSLTFDDVRLKSGSSVSMVPPASVSLETKFSRRIALRIPVVSSAMDTVTEHAMAIALAKCGGIGVIHRNLTPKDQAGEVARVKFYLNGRIDRPIAVRADETIGSILKRREEKRYAFHSFPVVDAEGKLVGLLTRNDFKLCDDASLPARAAMTTELITAPVTTSLDEAYEMMRKNKKKVLPLVDRNGVLAGMYVFSDVQRIKSGGSAAYNVDEKGHLRVAAAVGVGDAALERASLLKEQGVDAIVIDTAHADSNDVFETLRALKRRYSDSLEVVAGNVSEGESAKRLVDWGADGVKVGQGPGSICTTRIVAGIGCPQVTAVYNCAKAIRGSGAPVCADGGIKHSGDIPIAIGAGASNVMLGRLLAGTRETPGETTVHRGVTVKDYRGMGSLGAMHASEASKERYRQIAQSREKLVPEGIEGVVPYQGEVDAILYQLLGGLRSGMGYVGAATIEELQIKADFHRLSSAGLAESHPHGVTVTRNAPNYRSDDL